jgi:hypothetical protein
VPAPRWLDAERLRLYRALADTDAVCTTDHAAAIAATDVTAERRFEGALLLNGIAAGEWLIPVESAVQSLINERRGLVASCRNSGRTAPGYR